MKAALVPALAAMALVLQPAGPAQRDGRPRVSVRPADDFEVTGAGESAAWRQAEWVPLRRREPDGHAYDTRFKTLYSGTGVYFLIEGTDRTLTATMNEDLWSARIPSGPNFRRDRGQR